MWILKFIFNNYDIIFGGKIVAYVPDHENNQQLIVSEEKYSYEKKIKSTKM